MHPCYFTFLGKFHTFACSGRYSPKLATYELHELDEYRRARQQQDTSVTDEELIEQMKDYEREVNISLTNSFSLHFY